MVRKTPTRRKKPATTPVRRRRTTTPRKKGMLSELFNPQMAQAGGKAVLSGAVGGAVAGLMAKVLPDTLDTKTKALYTIGGGFVMATMLKMPNVGSGMAGVGMFQLLTESGFLAEDSNYDYADDIESLPMVLNENGFLQDSGFLQENGFLQDGDLGYNVGYYPQGFGGGH